MSKVNTQAPVWLCFPWISNIVIKAHKPFNDHGVTWNRKGKDRGAKKAAFHPAPRAVIAKRERSARFLISCCSGGPSPVTVPDGKVL